MHYGFLGVVHLPPMPGDPLFSGDEGWRGVERRAYADAEALVEGGVDGLVIENFGSVPFCKGTSGARLPAHQVATMAIVARHVKDRFSVPVGVNCLRNDAMAALGIAAAADLSFVRVNVHTGTYVTDQGTIEGEADATLRYRHALGSTHVAILADVLVKHASPLGATDPCAASRDCLARGLADGLIVTGSATGDPIDFEILEQVRSAAGQATVLLGSGLNPQTAPRLAGMADGAIVGSFLKHDGHVGNPVDRQRVKEMARALRGSFRTNRP